MRALLSALVILATLSAGCRSTLPQPTADVYLLSGQSNMQGIGRIADLPADWQRPIADVFFWNGTAFEPLDPGRTRLSTRAGEFGPEIGFARGMRDAGRDAPLYLVKFHRSGQALHAGWDGNAWRGPDPGPDRATFHPGDGPDDPAVGRHYRDWIRQVRSACHALRVAGVEPVIRGVVWMQGEQDSKHAASADEYASNLLRLRDRLGADLDAPDLPWVYGQVLPHEPAKPRFSHRETIRTRMAELDAVRGMRMVPTEGMPLLEDTVHYDAEGQRRLGLAFAAAMLELERR